MNMNADLNFIKEERYKANKRMKNSNSLVSKQDKFK